MHRARLDRKPLAEAAGFFGEWGLGVSRNVSRTARYSLIRNGTPRNEYPS